MNLAKPGVRIDQYKTKPFLNMVCFGVGLLRENLVFQSEKNSTRENPTTISAMPNAIHFILFISSVSVLFFFIKLYEIK